MTDRRGHIKISRKFFEEDRWWNEKRKRTRAEAWLDLLYLAAFRARDHVSGYGVVHLDRGQLVASLRFLATRWRWSVMSVRTFIAATQKLAQLEALRETPTGTVYRVVNYDHYQGGTGGGDTADSTANNTEVAQPKHSTSTNKKQLSSKAGTATWLTPFADAWQSRCGNPPFARLAKILAPLTDQLGAPEALARWSRYLDATEPRYCSPNRFSNTHAAYAGPAIVEMTDDYGRTVPHRKNAAGDWEPIVSIAS